MINKLKNKILDKKASIGIVGLGYVGLPLAIRFLDSGFKKVIGLDNNSMRVQSINQGLSDIKHIRPDNFKKYLGKQFYATNDLKLITELDVIIVCLPTPLNEFREPDLSIVTNFFSSAQRYFKKYQVVSFESTTYPGTSREVILPFFKDFDVGRDFFLCYSPEREDPGNKVFNTKNTPKVLSGYSGNCKQLGHLIYSQIVDKVVHVSSLDAAEMTKLLENIHRCINISLVNELKLLCDKMNIDIWEVIDAASSKPFGFTPYYPGPGLGGHCIPVDPFYLSWKARQFDINTKFIELAGEINADMPNFVFSKIIHALNFDRNKSLSKSKILVLGVAYKKNIDDLRESPSLKIIELLIQGKAKVSFSDPFIDNINVCGLSIKGIKLTQKNISKFDCVVLLTDHDIFDYKFISKNAACIVDTRNKFNKGLKKVFKA